MAARTAKVIVPVCSMERDTAFGDIEDPGNAGQVESAGGNITRCHMPRRTFVKCNEISGRRGVCSTQSPASGGGTGGKHRSPVFVGEHHLLVEANFDEFFVV